MLEWEKTAPISKREFEKFSKVFQGFLNNAPKSDPNIQSILAEVVQRLDFFPGWKTETGSYHFFLNRWADEIIFYLPYEGNNRTSMVWSYSQKEGKGQRITTSELHLEGKDLYMIRDHEQFSVRG